MEIKLKEFTVRELVDGYRDDGDGGGACYSDNRSKWNIGGRRL